MKKRIVLYNPKLPKLTKNEQEVLKILIEAGKLIAPIYSLQENNKYPGANFYPHTAAKNDIEKAARKNPDILSPFTVVEEKSGKLTAVPYHEKYADLLQPVIKKLNQAAEIADNKEFAKRLKIQAKSLQDGSYEEAIIAWMSMKPYILDITIGPIERYDDELFFVKCAYQAWVGVWNKKETDKATKFQKIIFSSQRKVLMPSEHVSFFDKVQTRIDKTLLFSGLIGKFKFGGTNLPNEIDLMEKYGSEITLFEPALHDRFVNKRLPIFKAVFNEKFQACFKQNGLFKASVYTTLLHELAHTFMRYRGAEKRLGNLFPVIDEIGASVLGVKACGSLLVKDVISQKEMEYLLVISVARLFDWLDELKKDHSKIHYVRGNAIALHYLLDSGALMIQKGISWPNFNKMFIAIDELAAVLDRILSMGSYKDAEVFVNKYGSLAVFDNFKHCLRKIY